MSLQSGSLDMAIHVPNTQASQVEGRFTVVEDTMKLVQALYLNNAVAPFDDVRVRQALCYAIDVQQILSLIHISGSPLWNVTPSRRVKVYVSPSSEIP